MKNFAGLSSVANFSSMTIMSILLFSAAGVCSEPKLNPSKPEDAEVIALIKKEIPPEFISYTQVILKESNYYRIMEAALQPVRNDKDKRTTYQREWHKVIYVQREQGTKAGDFEWFFEPNLEKVEILIARRIRGESYLSIDPQKIRDDTVDADSDKVSYKYERKKYFSLEDVRKGDVVEFKLRVTSTVRMGPAGFGGLYPFGGSYFQGYIKTSFPDPSLKIEACFAPDKNVELYFKIRGPENLISKSERNPAAGSDPFFANAYRVLCFSRENIEPEIVEINAPYGIYRQPRLYVTTWKDWSLFENWLAGKYGELLASNEAIKAKVEEITGTLTEKEDVTREIFHWIEKNLRYVQLYLRIDPGHLPRKGSEIFTSNFGDCKDKTALFISMLSVKGIKAYPVFISTSHLADADLSFPMIYQFNHMITYVEDIGMFLDPTGNFTPYPFLSEADKGRSAMILKDGKLVESKTPWKDTDDFLIREEDDISVVPVAGSGSVELVQESTVTMRGSYASSFYRLASLSEMEMEDYMRNQWVGNNRVLIDYEIVNQLDDYNNPVILKTNYSETLEDAVSESGEITLPGFMDIPNREIFKTSQRRNYPFLWQPLILTRKRSLTIIVPEGYKIAQVPDEIFYDGEATFHYSASSKVIESEGKETIRIEEVLRLKKAILNPDEFRSVKAAIADIWPEKNSRIKLVKRVDG